MKSVKTILIFFFYVCCFNKYHFSENLCEDCCNLYEDCCNLCNENLYENLKLCNENSYKNLDNNEISAINIFCKLNKIKQYSISSIDNCEGSTHKCKKITLNNSKNEEFILFIKGDKDPTFVFESLKAIGMSEINYVYYNGYLVTSKVNGEVYENGHDFDFSDLENLNVYRFFCSLFGCSDCEPFYRIDNVYIKNNEVFLLDFCSCNFFPIKTIEEFLDKLTYHTQNIPSAIVYCNNNYLKEYKDEEEQAFWVSVDMIHCGAYCKEKGYFATNLNNNVPIACSTCLLRYLKLYCSLKLGKKNEEIFDYLKTNMSTDKFINAFKEYCKRKKKEPDDEDDEDDEDDVEGLLEKLDNKNLEKFFNEELEWGIKIIKHTKTKMEEYSQKENKLKKSYKFSDLEKQQIWEKLNQLIKFYQSNKGKELIEKYQNNFKIVISYLKNLISVPDFKSYIENDIENIIKDFVHNNSKYIIEKKSLF